MDDATKNYLDQKLNEVLDQKFTAFLEKVATKEDLRAVENRLEGKIQSLQTTLQGEIDSVKTTLQTEIDNLARMMADGLEEVKVEIRKEHTPRSETKKLDQRISRVEQALNIPTASL